MSTTLISLVVPTHNEQDNITPLYRRVVSTFQALPDYTFELIFSDDSADQTPQLIQELHAADPRVKLVKLSRRFSQSIAIAAGLKRATGAAVVLMDADLQDPPEIIQQMLERWREGFQVVYAERASSSNYRLYGVFANAFYRLLRMMANIEIPQNAGEFRLMDRSVINFLNSLTEHTRFMRGLTVWPAEKCTAIRVNRAERQSGTTNYNFRRSLLVALDGFASFSIVPLRLAALVGIILAFGSLVVGAAYIVAWFINPVKFGPSWSSLFVSIWFLGGVQLLFVGILGEYLGRVYVEVQNRPLYWVAYEVGFKKAEHEVEALGAPPSRFDYAP
jgi:dolichol-phosphate mannosyltransferase